MEISRFELLNAWDEAFTMVIKKNLHQIIIESDSQLTVNAIHCKNSVPRDTVNLVIRNVGFLLNEVTIGYCPRRCNREADRVVKSAHRQLV